MPALGDIAQWMSAGTGELDAVEERPAYSCLGLAREGLGPGAATECCVGKCAPLACVRGAAFLGASWAWRGYVACQRWPALCSRNRSWSLSHELEPSSLGNAPDLYMGWKWTAGSLEEMWLRFCT